MTSRTASLKQAHSSPGTRYLQKNYSANDVLAEGYLTKIGQRWKSHKRRWFVISFLDIRYYENRVRRARILPRGAWKGLINISLVFPGLNFTPIYLLFT